ncbi:MAG: YceI family protein [Ignavibacteria bacterium]|jgi:polyisoprenoid-binding protein YceI|nr:YceI family protein [Ignavibacteria bacterium]MDH7527517.1 YceI family protein [Ignavibacteria bacterium]
MKYLANLFVFILFINVIYAQSKNESVWVVDKAHSKIGFSVTHLLISEVEGHFKDFDLKVVSTKDDFVDAKIEFTAKTASIFTDNEKRDEHLKSDDFFNSEKYPEMKFVSKSFKKVGKNKYKLTGDLTIRDVTKPITLDVVYNGTVKDPWGNTKSGFNVTGQLNRFDYGLKWNALTELGGAVVDKIVKLRIHVELNKQS